MQQLTLTQAPTPAQQALLNAINPNTKWVAGRKIKLVEKFENRSTHSFSDTVHAEGTITYMDPAVFDVKSTGSLPCGGYVNPEWADWAGIDADEKAQAPAEVSDIQKVRLMQARDSYRAERLTVNLSPYDEGGIAAAKGQGEQSNPYDIFDHANYFEWLAGFEDAY